jgi:DNA-binding response OmpR family regulator
LKTHVLFIENDADTFYMLNHILKNNGYEVTGFSSFNNVESLFSSNPAIILLDEWLGNITGNEICLQIKAHADGKNIPVILISAVYNLEKIALKCMADGFISKPFDLNYLLKFLKDMLAKYNPDLGIRNNNSDKLYEKF